MFLCWDPRGWTATWIPTLENDQKREEEKKKIKDIRQMIMKMKTIITKLILIDEEEAIIQENENWSKDIQFYTYLLFI